MKTVNIIIAFCIGLLLGHLFFPSKEKIVSQPPDITIRTQDAVNKIDSVKSIMDSVLKKRNKFLSGQLKIVNDLLAQSKLELKKSRGNLSEFNKRITRDSCFKNHSQLRDSLKSELSDLNLITDSIICEYEQKIFLTENRVALRDSELVICNSDYHYLKDILKEQSLRELQLEENLKTALRQQKRTRLQNKFLAAGMLFISGLTTSLIVKSRQ